MHRIKEKQITPTNLNDTITERKSVALSKSQYSILGLC